MSIAEKHSLALRRVWSYRQRCGHCHTTLAVQMPEDHTIRPSVVLAQWFDCPRAALGDRAATLCEGGDARLCPSQGPRSECLAVPVSLVVILHKQLNFHSFCATISPRKDVGFVANFAQEVEKGQLPLSVKGLSGQGVEQFGRSEAFVFSLHCHLSFPDHVHELNPNQSILGCRKRLEPQHETRDPLHASMVLLYDIIKIFDLADRD